MLRVELQTAAELRKNAAGNPFLISDFSVLARLYLSQDLNPVSVRAFLARLVPQAATDGVHEFSVGRKTILPLAFSSQTRT
jgi:hypothetical protein